MCGDPNGHEEDLDIAVLDGDRFIKELSHLSKVQGAFVLASVQKDASHGMNPESLGRLDTSKERSEVTTRRGGDSVCMSSAQKRAYLDSATGEEKSQNAALKDEFERLRRCILPPEEIDAPDPKHKRWADDLMSKSRQYRCLREMPETVPRDGDPMLTIEEKDGLTERPPHRQYKTPRHLLPELEKFITEMLQKGWIEPSTSEYSSPVLIIPKPPPSKKYRFVVDLRAVNERTKRLTHYMPSQRSRGA